MLGASPCGPGVRTPAMPPPLSRFLTRLALTLEAPTLTAPKPKGLRASPGADAKNQKRQRPDDQATGKHHRSTEQDCQRYSPGERCPVGEVGASENTQGAHE